MSDENDLAGILVEDIDEETLSKMPDWFKVLREAYEKQKMTNVDGREGEQCKKRSS